jgi:hypothetical protein
MENRIKHLEFIQNIINRMNTNSFQLKGLLITIISAIFAIYASSEISSILFIGYFPSLIFWFLDAYYLQQERKFRGVYDNVCGLKNEVVVDAFEMPIHKFKGGKYNYWNTFFSRTILLFYLMVIIIQIIVALIIF